MSINSIGIIGVGGVGGYFGGKLCSLLKEGSEVRVSFVARGEHLRVIQESGLLLSSEQDGEFVCQPSLATDDFQKLPRFDFCLLCVKEFDLGPILERLKPLVGDDTIVLPLLNGVDVYERVRKVIGIGTVLPACVYVGTHIERPGKVVQSGGACKILFGPDPRRPDVSVGSVVELFVAAKIKNEWTLNIQSEVWKKFIFICAYGLVSAAYGRTVGEILEDDRRCADVGGIMAEAIAVAKRAGVNLPADIAEASIEKARSFPPETKTSFQRDYERAGKSDERDLFAGSIIRMAGKLGVEVPKTREIAAVLEKRKPGSAARLTSG